MKYIIYKATNKINGKSYIGFDSNWPRRRETHKSHALRGSTQYISKAIRKHGWESFVWEVIYQSNDLDFTKNIMEGYFIRLYDTFGEKGYNLTLGGEGTLGRKYSPTIETRKLLSKKIKGRHFHTNESKQKISEAAKGREPWQKGTKGAYSKEHLEKLSKAAIGNKGPTGQEINMKYVYLVTYPDGRSEEIINLTRFQKENNLRGLYQVASGKRKHHKGFKAIKLEQLK